MTKKTKVKTVASTDFPKLSKTEQKDELERYKGKVFTFITEEFKKLTDELNKQIQEQNKRQATFATTKAMMGDVMKKFTNMMNDRITPVESDCLIFNSALVALVKSLEEHGIMTFDEYKKKSTAEYMQQIENLKKKRDEQIKKMKELQEQEKENKDK